MSTLTTQTPPASPAVGRQARPRSAPRTATLPGTVVTGIRRIGFEIKGYFRSMDAVFFVFLFPILMLGIFGLAFNTQGEVGALPDGSGGIMMSTYYLPGLVAAGLLLSGTQSLAIDISREKFEGSLRRLGATPLSPIAYFIGKLGMVFVTCVLQTIVLLAFAVVVFDAPLPSDGEHWLTFTWVFLLGIATMSLCGIALSALPRSTRSSTAVVLPIVLLLQFISGVYLQFTMLPEWLQNVASVFPLKWLAQGMRAVFLPDQFAAQEMGGEWDLGIVALVLAAWAVVALLICLLTFRWVRRS